MRRDSKTSRCGSSAPPRCWRGRAPGFATSTFSRRPTPCCAARWGLPDTKPAAGRARCSSRSATRSRPATSPSTARRTSAAFEAFFLPSAQWEQVRDAFWARTGFPVEAQVRQRLARLVEENQRAALAGIVMASPASTPPAIGAPARRQPAPGNASPCRTRCCSEPTAHALTISRSSSTPSSPTTTPVLQPTDRVHRPRRALRARRRALPRERPRPRRALHRHPRLHRDQLAAFVMVGMRFCPRIRNLHRQRIYCADPARDHGVLEPVLQRGRRAVNFRLIAEQWDRNCGPRCGGGCSRSSRCTPWPAPSTTASGAASALARSTTR